MMFQVPHDSLDELMTDNTLLAIAVRPHCTDVNRDLLSNPGIHLDIRNRL